MNRTFIADTAIRVLRTFAQALFGALSLDGAGVINASWTAALAVAGSAALLAVLTALAGATVPATSAPEDAPQGK